MSSRRRAGSSLGWSCALRRGRTPSTSPPTSELQLAAMSLVWGREGMGALDLAERQELLRRIKAAGFGGFDFEAAGLRLFCEAEYAGEPTAFGLTAAEDGEPPCLKLVFRVTEAGM